MCLKRVPVGQELLREMEGLAENGNWGDLETALQRVQGPPNDAATNLRYAAICATPTLSCRRTLCRLHSATCAWLLELSSGQSLGTQFLLERGRLFCFILTSATCNSPLTQEKAIVLLPHVQHFLKINFLKKYISWADHD